jgi:hypothetical protein
VCELDVEQQVGNTCAPRALITALESIYCPTELEATSFKDIDQKAEGVGAEWIQPHLDGCDTERRIIVIESVFNIHDLRHKHPKTGRAPPETSDGTGFTLKLFSKRT